MSSQFPWCHNWIIHLIHFQTIDNLFFITSIVTVLKQKYQQYENNYNISTNYLKVLPWNDIKLYAHVNMEH
jgi:hypothetical protein